MPQNKLYVIKLKNNQDEIYKIGITSCPSRRFTEISKTLKDLEVVKIFTIRNAKIAEEVVHKLYKDKKYTKHFHRELFVFNERDIEDVLITLTAIMRFERKVGARTNYHLCTCDAC